MKYLLNWCLYLSFTFFFLLSSFIFISIFTSISIPGIHLETYSSKFSWREILYRFRIDIVNIDLRWELIYWSAQHHSHLFSRNIPPLLNSNLVSPKVPISLQPEHMTNWWLSQAVFNPEPRKEIVSLRQQHCQKWVHKEKNISFKNNKNSWYLLGLNTLLNI